MASCSFTHGGRTFTLTVIEKSYSIANNTSDVTWTLTISGGGSTWYDTFAKCTVNGSVVYNKTVSWSAGAFPAVDGSTSGTISGIVHDSSTGAKSISFKLEGYNGAASYSTQTASGTLTLTTIPRISDVSLATSSIVTGGILRVNYTPKSSTFDYWLKFTCGSWSHSTNWLSPASTSAQTYQYTVPHSIANSISGAISATMTVTLYTAIRSGSNYTLVGSSSKTCTVNIPTTPITSVTSPVVLGTATEAVKFTPTATSLKYRIRYVWGPYSTWTTSGYISPASTSAYTNTGTVPISWAPYLWDAASDTFTIELVTYTSGNKEVGRVSKTATFTIPSYSPTFSKAISEGTASGYGVYVQSLSTVTAVISSMGTSYNSQGNVVFTTVQMTVDGQTYTKTGTWSSSDTITITSNTLTTYGSKTVTLKLTDSRGRSATQTQTITVYQYFRPSLTNLTTAVSGTTVTVNVDYSVAPVNNLNAKTITIVRKNTRTAAEVTVVDSEVLTSYSGTYTLTETVADVDTVSYEYIVTLSDSRASASLSKSTGVICISRLAGGLGIRFFAEAEEEGFWIANQQYSMTDAEFLVLAAAVSESFSTTTSYVVGDYCIANNAIYRCIQAHTGAWSASDFERL